MSKDDLGLVMPLKKSVDNLLRKLKKLIEARKERVPCAPTISTLISGSLKDIEAIQVQCNQLEDLFSLLQKQKVDVDNKIDEVKTKFGLELDELLKNGNFKELSGQFPHFRSGFFNIETNAKKWTATIWYGPQQEELGSFPLDAKEVFDQLVVIKRELGSPLDPARFLECLKECALKVQDQSKSDQMPIIGLLDKMVLLFKAKQLASKPYSRKDFSFDLYRLKKSPSYPEFSARLHLIVATRQDTSKKDQFLWIPDDDAGSGTTYGSVRTVGSDDVVKKESTEYAADGKNRGNKSAAEPPRDKM